MKNERGVSLLEVIVAVIILLMIAFFAIYNSKSSVKKAEAVELYSEMKSVETAVGYINSRLITVNGFTLEQGKHYDEAGATANEYIIYGLIEHSDGTAAKNLGIEGLKRDYIVNFETKSFELETAVDVGGTKVKKLSELESMINGGIK